MIRVLCSAVALLIAASALAQPQAPTALLLKGRNSGWGGGCPQGSAVMQEANLVGLPVTVVDPIAWANEDFFDYTMIFLEDCQDDPTYNAWNARLADLQAWVTAGGFLGVHATTRCGPNANVKPDIPGGTPAMVNSSAGSAGVPTPNHPIVQGLGSPPTGNWIAHDEYTTTGDPNDTILLTNLSNGNPILFERLIGNGAIIYGGLTYSCYVGGCGGCIGGGAAGDAGLVVRNEISWGSTFTLCGLVDSDGDGTGDDCDVCPFDPLDDYDHDGICDSSDPCPFGDNVVDTDGDGIVDGCDPCPIDAPDDADGDGVCDSCQNGHHDDDGDGVGACLDNCPYTPNPGQADDDGDGVGNECDVCANGDDFNDADSDGFPDGCDNCPALPSGDQSDDDGDGYGAPCDICLAGDDDVDADGDTFPDACDICPGFDDLIDGDGDTFPDACDNCPVLPDADQSDPDGDDIGTPCDVCPAGNDRIDTDGDTIADACDLCDGFDDAIDADGDTIPDACDNCIDIPNTAQADLDRDGAGTVCDCDDEEPFVSPSQAEFCDDLDNDCDDEIDEDAIDARVFYADADGDGRGDGDVPVLACGLAPGISLDGEDCDDTRADVHPNAPERCDSIDNDCDGDVDGVHCPAPVEEDPDEVRGGCQTAPSPVGGLPLVLAALVRVRRRP